jgi:hypothetical protein
MNLKNMIAKFNPAISKNWLLILAGIMWTGAGIMLCIYAITWLAVQPSIANLLLGLLGIGISIAANRFEFTNLAIKNIERILILPENASFFAFQSLKGYLIIVVMITGGILLRHSAIPKPYLAVAYAAIGGALFLASFQYYARFRRVKFSRLSD